ncbi:Nucleotidyltransferase [Viridothelium virens]|uniref:DNA-directed DNA polymerase n=1 Tax=Viridothelium virens TaxID=1048519 RepID=A0A6A6H657_VIRVR|nr:Nucleotidyltransferase [Viridothelium virens]
MTDESSVAESQGYQNTLDFADFPPIFVLPTHMNENDVESLVDKLERLQAPHTYDVAEAKLILGRVTKKRRAEYELRCRKLWTKEVEKDAFDIDSRMDVLDQPPKRRKTENSMSKIGDTDVAIVIEDSSTESEIEVEVRAQQEPTTREPVLRASPAVDDSSTESEQGEEPISEPMKGSSDARSSTPNPASKAAQAISPPRLAVEDLSDTVKVIKTEWLDDSLRSKHFLPLDSYMIYEGRPIARPANAIPPYPQDQPKPVNEADIPEANKAILERAKADMEAKLAKRNGGRFGPKQQFQDKTFSSSTQSDRHRAGQLATQATQLLHQTTSEHDSGDSSELPEMPDWVKQNLKYACERSTPSDPPNQAFIAELKKIRLARLLTADEIGVRAYSTSIASLAAYPHRLTSPREILQLPGCDTKIANLWVEYRNSEQGALSAATDAEHDPTLRVLRLFHDIWGVGATTAREFHYDRGWRDLDDVVEYGWQMLNREQQIGVKFYAELLQPIPRDEVAAIASVVHAHGVRVRDDRVQSLVVGGYRRGKEGSGDVDVILSHPEPRQTLRLAHDVVASLEGEGWVTHTLQVRLTNSQRGQSTLPFRTAGGGHGFDSLDKALVMWQDPEWPGKAEELAKDSRAKNPNLHRRVDIIVSPWRTVGCAVMGWSGGTTFQRDLRRYAKNVKGWKFDSSGVRDRRSGRVVDLEGKDGVAESMEEAERKVFEGLGLVYREPWERCTG